MDASQYKDYVLVLLFLKYISDKSKQKKNSSTCRRALRSMTSWR